MSPARDSDTGACSGAPQCLKMCDGAAIIWRLSRPGSLPIPSGANEGEYSPNFRPALACAHGPAHSEKPS